MNIPYLQYQNINFQLRIRYYLLNQMSRSRFSSQEVFLSQADRLKKERQRLLKERNQQFYKPTDQNMYLQPGTPYRNYMHQNVRQNLHGRRSPRMTNITHSPNIEEVKIMLDDIMKNSERHGMDQNLSLQYLRDIQFKLSREIEEFNISMRRTVESDKLRNLKTFVDRLVSTYDPQVKVQRRRNQKSMEVKQANRRGLEKIPEAAYPSISSEEQSPSQSSSQLNQITSSQGKDSSQIRLSEQYSDSNANKDITIKKINTNDASGLLDILQNKIFEEVSFLRRQNNQLRRQIEELRNSRSPSRGRRKDSLENQTLINQLVRNDPKTYQLQNNRLKNKIRTLEMELIHFRTNKHIDNGRGTDSRMHISLEGKDNQIRYLRKEMQDLILHLDNTKQQAEYLKQQVADLNSKLSSKVDYQQKLLSNIKHLESELYKAKGASSRVLGEYQKFYRDNIYQNPFQASRRAPDFKKKNFVDDPVYNEDGGKKSSDKFGEYREVLFTLRSLRK